MTAQSSMLPNSRYSPPTTKDGRWRKLLKRVWFYRFYYLLALPGILYCIIFHYLPMIGIVIAFKDISPFGRCRWHCRSAVGGLEAF